MTPKRKPAKSEQRKKRFLDPKFIGDIITTLIGKIIVALAIALLGLVGSQVLETVRHISPSTPTSTLRPALATPSPMRGVVFEDSFTGGLLDTTRWVLESNTAGVSLGQGFLQTFSQVTRYPYIYSRVNPIPLSEDFRIGVRYRYLNIGTCGATIAMTSFFLPTGLSQDETNRLSANAEATGISIWFWHEVIFYRSGSERSSIALPGPYIGPHEATVEYANSRYQLNMDGNRLYTSGATSYRPGYIWIGNPVELAAGFDCPWDTLEVNNVRVQLLR